ncbi:MAG: nuclear transport factor 2 family protein, partial [Steroidobacteraceae bacterium]
DLFAENATLELGQNGVYAGKPAIRRYLQSLTGGKNGLATGQLNNHFTLSPVITVAEDGRSAKARWRLLLQDGVWGDSNGGNWGAGVYENEYAKENDVWKISKLQLYVRFHAPYRGGWTQATKESTARYGRSAVKPSRASESRTLWPARFTPPFHFDNPGTSFYRLTNGASAAIKATPAAAKTVADVEARARALELQIDRLQAAEDVENLEGIYGYYADKSQQDAISALFTKDATLEILGRGVFIGTDRIYEYMRRLGVPTPGTLFNHMQLQPVVTVAADGASAQVRARLMVMFARDTAAQWGDGVYENRFVKENGVWKYQSLAGFHTFYTNYEEGWTRHSAGMFAPFPAYPPDLPQSVDYDPYPASFIPRFHYANPVTGRTEVVSPQKSKAPGAPAQPMMAPGLK